MPAPVTQLVGWTRVQMTARLQWLHRGEDLALAESDLPTRAVRVPDAGVKASLSGALAHPYWLSHDGSFRVGRSGPGALGGVARAVPRLYLCMQACQLGARLRVAIADGPRPGNSCNLGWTYGQANGPRLRPGGNGDPSRCRADACRPSRSREGARGRRRAVDGASDSLCIAPVRRVSGALRPQLRTGNADRRISRANIPRPSVRWLYRQTYSLMYPCSHLRETA